MHPRLEELVGLLGEGRAEVLGAVSTTGNPPPATGAWSVPEILDHLAIVETGVSKLVHVQLSRHAQPLPRETSTESVAGRLDHVRLDDRRRKVIAPESVRPRPGITTDEAMDGLRASRTRLLETLGAADGVALDQFSWPHPMLGTLDFYQWILFVAIHERRHARQILEMSVT